MKLSRITGAFIVFLLMIAPSASAADQDLVASCTEQELVRPVVTHAAIHNPGQYGQSDAITIEIAATPDECHGVVQRQVQYEEIKKERLRINGRIIRRISRIQRWGTSDYRADAAGQISQVGAANPHNTRTLYKCSYKKAITKVRVKMRIVIRDLATGQEVARRIFWGPLMEIRGINGGKGC